MKTSQYLLKTSREYALYIAKNRAIPFVGDGLKHGQRISLWLLKNRSEKIKTYALGGLMAYERLYVHGDASANTSISTLAAPYKNNYPLIEGLGQFGNRVAPEGIGAPRYTDVKRSKVAETILYCDSDLIPLESNYDNSNEQPIHFLPLIPTVLLNGVEGIAVGWSTDILSYKITDLIEATKLALKGKPIPKLIPHFERYNIVIKATEKPNQWEFSGKVEVKGHEIHVSELPPGLSLINFKEHLINLEEKEYISGYTDRSTDTINIIIKMPGLIKLPAETIDGVYYPARMAEPEFYISKMSNDTILDFLKLRQKTTERIVVIDWNGDNIRVYNSPEEVVNEFAQWRLGWYSKRYEKYIKDDNNELLFWKAIVCLYEKKFPQKLGTHANKLAMETEINDILTKAKLKFDDHHLNRIVGLATYRWTKEFEQEAKDKVQTIVKRITDNTKILNSPEDLKKVYLAELDAIDVKKL